MRSVLTKLTIFLTKTPRRRMTSALCGVVAVALIVFGALVIPSRSGGGSPHAGASQLPSGAEVQPKASESPQETGSRPPSAHKSHEGKGKNKQESRKPKASDQGKSGTGTPREDAPRPQTGHQGKKSDEGAKNSPGSSSDTPGVRDSARPGPANTGVPTGIHLTKSKARVVTKAGTVLKNLNVQGNITVKASNITIKDSVINGRILTGGGRYRNIMIDHVEIAGPDEKSKAGDRAAVSFAGFTCNACNVHGWTKGFIIAADVTITNSWVHDVTVFGDPAAGGSHSEAVLATGGHDFTIVNNTFESGYAPNVTATLALMSQQSQIRDVLVKGNFFSGGNYCVYAASEPKNRWVAQNVRFLNNVFLSDDSHPRCGKYGAVTAYQSGNGNQWSGNVFENGQAIPAP